MAIIVTAVVALDADEDPSAAPELVTLTPEQAAEAPKDDSLVVSIGDSVASGEGNPDVTARLPLRRERWLLRRCHRSLRSGHAEAALLAERADPDRAIAFVPLACSGATIDSGLLHSYRGIQPDRGDLHEPPQLDRVNALAQQRRIDALLVSVGANDVYFSNIVKFCIAVTECSRRRFNPDSPFAEAGRRHAPLAEVVRHALGELPARYAAFDARLSKRIPRSRVVIVEYFDPTRADRDRNPATAETFCRMPVPGGEIEPAESRWAHEAVLGPLNEAVHDAGATHGWRVVGGVAREFTAHGICARPAAERWVRSLPESLQQQGLNFSGTLHPNGLGHQATALLIEPVLGELLAARGD